MKRKWQLFRSDESGGVAVACALGALAFLGVAAIVMDIGHVYVVRQEARKAVEAGASGGIASVSDPSLPSDNRIKDYKWTAVAVDNARNGAMSTIRANFVDCAQLTGFNTTAAPDFSSNPPPSGVQVGYWDRRWTRSTAPKNLNGYTNPVAYIPIDIAPDLKPYELPAVKVNITKVQGQTGANAPVRTFFAGIWGSEFAAVDVRTDAVAMFMSTPPTGAPPGDCFPMAMPKTYVDNNWAADPPVSFRIGTGGVDGGDWTSFLVDANNVPTVRELIDNGNPTPLHIGDHIWIEPGVKDSLYSYAESRVGQTMMLAVIGNNCDTHAWTPILGFVAFQIEAAVGGEGKYIQGHMVKDYVMSNGLIAPDPTKPPPPYFGAGVAQAKMVQ